MAILKFRIYWEEDEGVYRDIAIRHQQTFFDLHQSILKSYEFDNKHQATFYKSNDSWQMGREISLEKYDKKYLAEPLLMAESNIGSQVADPNQKFVYEYDFAKNWRFMIELININKEEDKNITYPVCVRVEGLGPSQYGTKGMIENRIAEIEEKYDLESDSLLDGFGEEAEESEEEGSSDTQSDSQEESDNFSF
jgi:hypothetical protein